MVEKKFGEKAWKKRLLNTTSWCCEDGEIFMSSVLR